ncbi:MAG: prepilin-type N-terminal cleavage/methylation domain-containing protein [Candidatus Riflebacteria bacterium]
MRRGFSLIELLVVVAIIAILVGVATPYYSDYVKESKRAKALQDLDVLKQSVVLFNSQEDLPYQGQLATTSPYLPLLGENDFNGLQGRYLTYIPVDPWGKNYKLDPYACYVYSEGADSRVDSDDIREYYVKDLALTKVEWEDRNNNRTLDQGDWLYFNFNKSLWISAFSSSDFNVYENSEVSTATLVCNLETDFSTRYTNESQASTSVIITEIGLGTTIKLGVHSLALKDELVILKKYQEVQCDRANSNSLVLRTRVERNNTTSDPLRYAVRTNPVKVTPK